MIEDLEKIESKDDPFEGKESIPFNNIIYDGIFAILTFILIPVA